MSLPSLHLPSAFPFFRFGNVSAVPSRSFKKRKFLPSRVRFYNFSSLIPLWQTVGVSEGPCSVFPWVIEVVFGVPATCILIVIVEASGITARKFWDGFPKGDTLDFRWVWERFSGLHVAGSRALGIRRRQHNSRKSFLRSWNSLEAKMSAKGEGVFEQLDRRRDLEAWNCYSRGSWSGFLAQQEEIKWKGSRTFFLVDSSPAKRNKGLLSCLTVGGYPQLSRGSDFGGGGGVRSYMISSLSIRSQLHDLLLITTHGLSWISL